MDLAKYCVNAVLVEGRSVREVAGATGRSKSWVHRHVALYRSGGEEALTPLKRGPKVPANLTSAEIEGEIVAWRKRLSDDGLDAGARTISWHMRQSGGKVPALSTIHRVLRRRGFVTPQPQKRPRTSWIRFESNLPNETWQSDMTHWHLEDDQPVEIINFVDDYSRAVLSSVAVPVATAPEVVRVFYETAALYGLPASVLSDNGAIYTTAYRGSHSGMEIELATLGHHLQARQALPSTDPGQGRALPSHAQEVAGQEAGGRHLGRAPGPDRPLRPHLQRRAPAHGTWLPAHASLARPRQGHHQDRRPAAAGPHQGPPGQGRQDRLFHAALPVQAPPRRGGTSA